jgi:ubiquinone/menaquinone biosynthesis C-methylase UbiE/uncharacterized protein YbaR (Trm112 family)
MPNEFEGELDDWYLQNLVCPRDHALLSLKDSALFCKHGHRYSIISGIPIMLLEDVSPTLHVMRGSIAASGQAGIAKADELFLETLGVDEDQRAAILECAKKPNLPIDPVVNYLVSHTNGLMYKHLVGKLQSYPIPEIDLPPGDGKTLLDIGCGWGRWCIAAARKGYQPVGIDPSLGAVLAARRVARKLGVEARFIVGDARYLPFPKNIFDTVYSYSVIQHFSLEDADKAIQEVGRVLASPGFCHVQLANAYGIRSLQHQFKRGFRKAEGFEVRYWRPKRMQQVFSDCVGNTKLGVDCFFGLGLQRADSEFMPRWKQYILNTSELLKRISNRIRPVVLVADSIFVSGWKT